MPSKILVTCCLCKRELSRNKCVPGTAIRPAMSEHLRKTHPDWDPNGYICQDDMNKQRAEHVQRMLESGKGNLTHLEADVEQSFKDDELISHKMLEGGKDPYTLGQRMADKVASFGGSWRFLISFGFFLSLWIVVNITLTFYWHDKAFDPYPFILLNLVLSCLASVQAPIIMMSQNRQEARDRKRGEDDYKINLKAELEIKNLHEKFDHLLEHQWQYLMEIQQIQVELMEEIASRGKK